MTRSSRQETERRAAGFAAIPSTPRRARRWLAAGAAGAALLLATPGSLAASDAAPPAEPAAAVVPPGVDGASSAPDSPGAGAEADEGLRSAAAGLLTRARVRARIEDIDPRAWLARYGAVERRESGAR